jgi:hypothetical protein
LVTERELTKHSHSAGMVFEANKATGDYHDKKDGHVFKLKFLRKTDHAKNRKTDMNS